MPSAIELIRFRILSGFSVVASRRNWTFMLEESSSTISIPTSLLMELRIFSLSSTGMLVFPFIRIMSYPRRYAPVISATMFSSCGSGYEITTSFEGLSVLFTVIEMVFSFVSISTSVLFSSLFASTHSFGSDTRILLPIFCRRRMNLVNLY